MVLIKNIGIRFLMLLQLLLVRVKLMQLGTLLLLLIGYTLVDAGFFLLGASSGYRLDPSTGLTISVFLCTIAGSALIGLGTLPKLK